MIEVIGNLRDLPKERVAAVLFVARNSTTPKRLRELAEHTVILVQTLMATPRPVDVEDFQLIVDNTLYHYDPFNEKYAFAVWLSQLEALYPDKTIYVVGESRYA